MKGENDGRELLTYESNEGGVEELRESARENGKERFETILEDVTSGKFPRRRENGHPEPPSGNSEVHTFCNNDIFDILGNERRRYVAYALMVADRPLQCRELAKQVTAWEEGTDVDQVTSRQYQSVYNSLYQSHLPEFERADLAEFDRANTVVTPSDRLDEVERLARFDAQDDGGRQRLLVGGVAGGALGGILFVGISFFSSQLAIAVAFGIGLAVVGSQLLRAASA